MTKSFTPYLYFPGNAAQAIAYYQEVLAAEDLGIITYGSLARQNSAEELTDVISGYTDSQRGLIAHAEIGFAGSSLSLEDVSGENQSELTIGTNVALSVTLTDADIFERYYNGLSKGGKIIVAAAGTCWAKQYGVVIDKFGIKWVLNLLAE